ncbi:MAG: GNVR domain-containing protein [Candidatus Omnitrophota bacterium]
MTKLDNSTTLQYFQIFFKRKAVFFTALCIVPLIVFNMSNFLPKRYSSMTLIKINDEKILNPIISDLAVSSSYIQRLKSIEGEILTWENLTLISSELNIAEENISQIEYEKLILAMRRSIDIKLVSDDLIRITYIGEDPYEAKAIVDRIGELFIQKNIKLQKKEADTATEFITQQLEVYQSKLDESERIVALYRLVNDLEKAREDRQLILKQLESQPQEIVSIREQQENPLVAEFKMNLIELEVELANLAIDSTENHPRVLEIKGAISKIKAQLQEAMKNPRSFVTHTPNLLYQELNQRLNDMTFKIEKMEKELDSIKSLNKDYLPSAMPEQELASLSRDNRVNEHIYGTLLARLETANITKQLEASKSKSTFEIIEKARLPVDPVGLELPRIIFFGLILGILSGVGLIMLIEFLDSSFKGIDDAREFLGQPVMGVISTIMIESEMKKKTLQSNLLVIAVIIISFLLASSGVYFYNR